MAQQEKAPGHFTREPCPLARCKIVAGNTYAGELLYQLWYRFTYLTAALAMMIWARSSDKRGERLWHVVLPILLAAMGFAAASVVQSNFITLVALTCTAVGVVSVFPPFNSLFKSQLSGPAVACGVAVCNSIGNLGGFVGPYLIGAIKEATGSYAPGMMVIALGLMISAVMMFVLGRALEPRTAMAAATRADSTELPRMTA